MQKSLRTLAKTFHYAKEEGSPNGLPSSVVLYRQFRCHGEKVNKTKDF